jgi:hypothetical protein
MNNITNKIGTQYKESGKVNGGKLVLALVIGYFLCGLIGCGYGMLTHINPLIYLNILILGGVFFLVHGSLSLLIRLAVSRNKIVNICLGVILSCVFFYNAWCAIISSEHALPELNWYGGLFFDLPFSAITDFATKQSMSVGKLGRSGLTISSDIMGIFYVIEILGFIGVIIYLNMKTVPFCEITQQYYAEQILFFASNGLDETTKKNFYKARFNFIEGQSFWTENSLPTNITMYKMTMNTVSEDQPKIFSLEIGTTEQDKNKVEFKSSKHILENTYGELTFAKVTAENTQPSPE